MYTYAQLDENNVCVFMAVSTNPIVGDGFILVYQTDNFVGFTYVDGEFVKPEPEVVETPTPEVV